MLKRKTNKQTKNSRTHCSLTAFLCSTSVGRIFLSSMILVLGNSELSSGFRVLLNVVENKFVFSQTHFSPICVLSKA